LSASQPPYETHFEKLANAAKNTISTNIPAALLPARVKLSGTVKHGADISSPLLRPVQDPRRRRGARSP
jgi:hypothetical protein